MFNACDGEKSFADVKLPEEIVYLSLDELKKQDLIEDDYSSPFVGMNRREIIRKVGLSFAVALPVVTGLLAPTAVQAQSGCTGTNGAGAAVCNETNAECQERARTLCAACSATFITGDQTCFQFNAVGGRCTCN